MGKFFIGIVILSVGILLVYLHVIALQYLAYIRLFKSILIALTLVPALAAASLTAGADGSCIPIRDRSTSDNSGRSLVPIFQNPEFFPDGRRGVTDLLDGLLKLFL